MIRCWTVWASLLIGLSYWRKMWESDWKMEMSPAESEVVEASCYSRRPVSPSLPALWSYVVPMAIHLKTTGWPITPVDVKAPSYTRINDPDDLWPVSSLSQPFCPRTLSFTGSVPQECSLLLLPVPATGVLLLKIVFIVLFSPSRDSIDFFCRRQ